MKFRSIPEEPIEFEAVQWDGSNWHEIYAFCDMDNKIVAVSGEHILLESPLGQLAVPVGAWVVRREGQFGMITDGALHEAYEEVPDAVS